MRHSSLPGPTENGALTADDLVVDVKLMPKEIGLLRTSSPDMPLKMLRERVAEDG